MFRLALCLLFLTAARPALAQRADDDEAEFFSLERASLEETLNIRTSVATRNPMKLRETPGLVTVITREEIQAGGARDLIDVLKLVPEFDFGMDVQGNLGLGVRGNWANGIPFYGSTKGMARDGAAASIGVSFAEMGKAAAAAALELRKGGTLPETIFPEQAEITINSDAAAKCGLKFPRAVSDEAAFRYP